MTTAFVRELNEQGMLSFHRLLADMAVVADPSERIGPARSILFDTDLATEIDGAGEIDLDATFTTARGHAAHVYAALAPCGPGVFSRPGVIAWLYLAHIGQLIGGKARAANAYDLGLKSTGTVNISRNYRNSLWVRLTFHHIYGDNDFIMDALFGGPLDKHSDAADRMAQRPAAIGSKSYVMLNIAMFFNPETGELRRKPRVKGVRGKIKSAKDAMVEFSVVYGQFARNYAVSRMSTLGLLDIIPDTAGLKPYKRFAKSVLIAE